MLFLTKKIKYQYEDFAEDPSPPCIVGRGRQKGRVKKF